MLREGPLATTALNNVAIWLGCRFSETGANVQPDTSELKTINVNMSKRAFVSHVTEEADLAGRLKIALRRDFLGFLDVFVSSDAESIAAGEEWLRSIEKALQESAILIVLCSPASVGRPWINFEAGAAWMRGIPLVPVCYAGLTPGDLPVPLSLRQGLVLDRPDGVQRLYTRIADILGCAVPPRSFEDLCRDLSKSVSNASKATPTLTRDRAIRKRLIESLEHHRFKWRTLERIATESGLPYDTAADFLRANEEVRFSKGKSGEVIVGLRSRVG